MTTLMKASSAADFLALVPHLLGFQPARSLVLVPFDGSRSLGAMRIDLPDDPTDEVALDGFASSIVGMVCRVAHADGFAAVVYTDASAGTEFPERATADAVAWHADACGLRLVDALYVAADGWGPYPGPHTPGDVRSLDELERAAASRGGLPAVAADQTAQTALPEVGERAREAAFTAFAGLASAVDILCGVDAASPAATRSEPPASGAATAGTPADDDEPDTVRVNPQALAAACRLDDIPGLFEDALGWDPASPAAFDAASLAWCLARPSLRDVALVQWSGHLALGDEAFDAQLRWERGEEYPTHLAMRMWGEGERPDPERLTTALDIVRSIAARTPDEARAGALATAAWLSWALGRSTQAEAYARAACDLDPEHGLAEIVLSFVAAAHLPDWAFRSSRRII
jgi:hypothetical protein